MMVKFRFFKCNNLNLWRITIVDKAVIYIHGKVGKDTDLYRLYNTNIHEKIAEQKKKEAMLQ